MKISVLLPRDRTRPGVLRLVDGNQVLLEAPCLGKSDNTQALKNGNPSRDPTRPWGDTPTGTYRPATVQVLPPDHRLGRYVIPLVGISGQALLAMQTLPGKPARTGLYVHATSDFDGQRGEDRLIPTYGCLRLLDRDMAALAGKLGDRLTDIEIDEQPQGV